MPFLWLVLTAATPVTIEIVVATMMAATADFKPARQLAHSRPPSHLSVTLLASSELATIVMVSFSLEMKHHHCAKVIGSA